MDLDPRIDLERKASDSDLGWRKLWGWLLAPEPATDEKPVEAQLDEGQWHGDEQIDREEGDPVDPGVEEEGDLDG